MSERIAFTDLEEGLFGPDGTQILRRTAGQLIALRQQVQSQIDAGLSSDDSAKATTTLIAIGGAERIMIDLKRSGE